MSRAATPVADAQLKRHMPPGGELMIGEKKPLHYASPCKDDRWPSRGCLTVVGCLGLLPLFLGSRWLYIFVFTDYRAHHRPVMIPLGFVTVLLGCVIISLPRVLKRKR